MKKFYLLLPLLILIFAAACSSVAAEESSNTNDGIESDVQTATVATALTTDYEDALDEAGQLAIGTLVIDESELAITAEQAETLLPLWQALQSLSGSDVTAGAEIDAVVNQIIGNMSSEQVSEIASLQLTNASFGELVQSGAIQIGGRGGPAGADGGENGGPQAGGLGGNGNRPGGGGGPGGPAGAGLSEEEIAEQRAERFGDGGANATTGIMTAAVVNLLLAKTGVEIENNRGQNPNNIIISVVASELGVTVEDVRATSELTVAEYIEAEGGDVEAIRTAIITELNASENFANADVETIVDTWLYGAAEEQ